VERIGPFRSSGGYDWTKIDHMEDVGQLQRKYKLNDRPTSTTLSIIGHMFAPVLSDGTLIGHVLLFAMIQMNPPAEPVH
jgi:hypothetical protein